MTIKRTDKSHAPIRDTLRAIGYTVYDTSQSDLADLVVVLKNGRVAIIVEAKPETGGVVTTGEVRFMLKLLPEVYRIIQTADQAVDVIARIEASFDA